MDRPPELSSRGNRCRVVYAWASRKATGLLLEIGCRLVASPKPSPATSFGHSRPLTAPGRHARIVADVPLLRTRHARRRHLRLLLPPLARARGRPGTARPLPAVQ